MAMTCMLNGLNASDTCDVASDGFMTCTACPTGCQAEIDKTYEACGGCADFDDAYAEMKALVETWGCAAGNLPSGSFCSWRGYYPECSVDDAFHLGQRTEADDGILPDVSLGCAVCMAAYPDDDNAMVDNCFPTEEQNEEEEVHPPICNFVALMVRRASCVDSPLPRAFPVCCTPPTPECCGVPERFG